MADQLKASLALEVERHGIYHALPTWPAELKGLDAIVFGANGISGHHMLRVLSKHPERWSTIYSISRKPQEYTYQIGQNVKHVSTDLLEGPSHIAKKLKAAGVRADYVFFFAYLQPAPPEGAPLWSNVEEMCDVNGRLLQNCVDALVLAGIKPKRFLLQTGIKHYGSHMGSPINPMEESDPRVNLEPNFYYNQEDILFAYSHKHGVEWNVTRPSFIWGAVPSAAMNIAYPLAVYASVQKHLGQTLAFPGDLAAWEKPIDQSSAMMNCYLAEWAVVNPRAKNEALNAGDGCPFTWARFWPRFAEWYGLETSPPDESEEYHQFTLPYKTPPRGYGPPATFRFTFRLVDWAAKPEIQQAWKELNQKHSLAGDPFKDIEQTFSFADFGLLMPYGVVLSMSKLRDLGWNAFVDTEKSIQQTIEEFAEMRMVPKIN